MASPGIRGPPLKSEPVGGVRVSEFRAAVSKLIMSDNDENGNFEINLFILFILFIYLFLAIVLFCFTCVLCVFPCPMMKKDFIGLKLKLSSGAIHEIT